MEGEKDCGEGRIEWAGRRFGRERRRGGEGRGEEQGLRRAGISQGGGMVGHMLRVEKGGGMDVEDFFFIV